MQGRLHAYLLLRLLLLLRRRLLLMLVNWSISLVRV
jgi:hypothetical protein